MAAPTSQHSLHNTNNVSICISEINHTFWNISGSCSTLASLFFAKIKDYGWEPTACCLATSSRKLSPSDHMRDMCAASTPTHIKYRLYASLKTKSEKHTLDIAGSSIFKQRTNRKQAHLNSSTHRPEKLCLWLTTVTSGMLLGDIHQMNKWRWSESSKKDIMSRQSTSRAGP